MFTVVVTGSRTWDDPMPIHRAFARLKDKYGTDVRIINGTARGADRLCATLAVGYDFKVVDMPADWNTWGKAAGFKRNVAMLEHLDAAGKGLVLAFWDGVSKGTQHTIREARKRGLDVHVCLPGGWVVDGSNPEG